VADADGADGAGAQELVALDGDQSVQLAVGWLVGWLVMWLVGCEGAPLD
jgi:hypothetical protein